MASQKQTINDLKQSNDFLTKKAEHQMLLLSGLQEQLEAATQFNIALLLKLGGSAKFTADDRKAVAGQTLARTDEEGGDFVLSVTPATGVPASTASH